MHSEQLLNGRYRLSEVLGSGGMSVVWRAKDEILDRTVAIKVLAGPDATNPAVRSRMLTEAQAAATLTHPHLINVYDYGESDGPDGDCVPFVVMEMVTGPTLGDSGVQDSLSPPEAIAICAQLARALAALHHHGLVHRDIKPSNVMLTPDGAKVIDFGIAAATGQPDLDDHGAILGTPSYVAPERLLGGDVTAASDVYALGVLIYWMLTGGLPWTIGSPHDTIRAHLLMTPAPLPPIDGVPPQVADICLRCLEKNPDLRPSATAVASALSSAVQQAAVDRDIAAWGAGRQTIAAAATTRARRRRTIILAGSTVLAVLLVLLAFPPFTGRPNAPSDGQLARPSTVPGRLPGPPPSAAASEPAPAAMPTTSVIVTTQIVPVPGTPGAFTTHVVTVPVTLPPSTIITTAPQPPPATTPAEPPPPPVGQTVAAIGGTARFLCQGTTATVVSAEPTPGFALTDRQAGSAPQVRVVFTSQTHQTEIIARCGPRGLMPTVKETPLPPA